MYKHLFAGTVLLLISLVMVVLLVIGIIQGDISSKETIINDEQISCSNPILIENAPEEIINLKKQSILEVPKVNTIQGQLNPEYAYDFYYLNNAKSASMTIYHLDKPSLNLEMINNQIQDLNSKNMNYSKKDIENFEFIFYNPRGINNAWGIQTNKTVILGKFTGLSQNEAQDFIKQILNSIC
jgi:hypothetical protein